MQAPPRDLDPGSTTYQPGPSATRLAIGIALREGEETLQTVFARDAGSRCLDDTLDVPVAMSFATDDGALDEVFDARLVLTSAITARLEAEVPTERLAGNFVFEAIAAPAVGWRAAALSIGTELWPGGSRGGVSPRLVYEGPLLAASPPCLPPRPEPQLAGPEPLTLWSWLGTDRREASGSAPTSRTELRVHADAAPR